MPLAEVSAERMIDTRQIFWCLESFAHLRLPRILLQRSLFKLLQPLRALSSPSLPEVNFAPVRSWIGKE